MDQNVNLLKYQTYFIGITNYKWKLHKSLGVTRKASMQRLGSDYAPTGRLGL